MKRRLPRKIAIPVWENKISPVMDTASRLMVVELKDGNEISRFEIYLEEQDLSIRCMRIQGLGIDTLLCSAITKHFLEMLRSSGIAIIPGVSGQPNELLAACLEGNLGQPKWLMPGSRMEELHEQLKHLDFRKA